MHIDMTGIDAGLDRGDGVCKYFDKQSKLCRIYESRPLICNVDKAYEKYFKDEMSKKEYYEINYISCRKLKEMFITREE